MHALEALLEPGVTLALLGPSGAGKSSLVNALVGREALLTGAVREGDARGRHTSVHRQLVARAAGGLIIDTPGMRELQLWESAAPVGDAFDDVTSFGGACRFRDCRHDKEPGCAVKEAVAAGTLAPGRYDSFVKLLHEHQELERRLDERFLLEEKRNAKIQGKALKSFQKDRGR
jgi:ribosome biogenesis GTPase